MNTKTLALTAALLVTTPAMAQDCYDYRTGNYVCYGSSVEVYDPYRYHPIVEDYYRPRDYQQTPDFKAEYPIPPDGQQGYRKDEYGEENYWKW